MDYYTRFETFEESIGGSVKQNNEEADALFQIIRERQAKTLIEVGSEWGGSLYCYAGACQPGARLISVDLCDRFPARMYLKRTLAKLTEEGYDVTLVRGNSHEADTVRRVREALLEVGSADVLHIDGDHSESGAYADWINYGPMLRPGGVTAFHDISHGGRGTHVRRAWDRITLGREEGVDFRELSGAPALRNKNRHLGIGVFFVPTSTQGLFDARRGPDFNKYATKLRKWTQTRTNKLHMLWQICHELPPGKKRSVIECGAFMGGSAALMAAATPRSYRHWVFDSFEGCPQPTAKDQTKQRVDANGKRVCVDEIMGEPGNHTPSGVCVGTVEQAFAAHEAAGIDPNRYRIVKGWIEETIPKLKEEIGEITVLRIDVDWYEPTLFALKELYPQVVVGGWVVLDDHGHWAGARRAAEEYFGKYFLARPAPADLRGAHGAVAFRRRG